MLIDEAHRSHSSTLHMNMLAALPNCASIGFTGTPIIMGAKKKTTDIFGPYIDIYRLATPRRDGAVVPIMYSGRTAKGAVRDGRDLDEVFEDMFADHTPEELEEIQRKYATKGDVMEAEKLIAAKAQEHPAPLRRDGATERLQGPARRAQPPCHPPLPRRPAQGPRRAGHRRSRRCPRPPATPTRTTWTGAPRS